jgi:TolA-binding protein
MTKPIVKAPERWTDDDSASVEGRLGELFRSVEKPVPLSPAALARVHARLGSARHSSGMRRRVREAVLAGVMLLAGSSLAVAGWGVNEWWTGRAERHERALQSGTSIAGTGTGALHASKRSAPQVAQQTSPAAPEENTDGPDIAVPLAPRVARTADHGSNTAPADSSELASESLALQAVLVKLRREHDAKGALALLDQSQPLFARGTLALEAQVARVDALLALGRQGEALTILNHLPLAHIGRGGELRLLRAELRAKDDCGLALADFDELVRRPLSPALAERALYGRAACEVRVGDSSNAQRDFRDYLTRFPHGRFADGAHRQLSVTADKVP